MGDPDKEPSDGSGGENNGSFQRESSTISAASSQHGDTEPAKAHLENTEKEASHTYEEIGAKGNGDADLSAVVVKRKGSRSSQGSSIDTTVIEEDVEEKLTCSEQWNQYPKHVLFIVGMEFCERFSYYGMRSVLLLYLRNYLKFSDDLATAVYHAFTVLAYFTPVFGAIIADSYWGKYKTIIVLSIVYILGHVVKVIGSIPYVPSTTTHIVLSMIGLVLIACGTGGIKPCVSSFGGDQFKPDQTVVRKQFFSLFYFAINAGSLISTFVTPILRADVNCYPEHEGEEGFEECYALAFGVPAALMIVALVLFIAGSKWYVRHPPEGSVFWHFCHCIGSGVKQRWNAPKEERTKDHWLDYAKATPRMIRDTKYVLNVLVLFIPLPFFWALFDQQGSRWTLQAIELDGHLGNIHLKPDQIETLNPIFIVTLIPLFEVTLYPCLRHFNINFSPLRRMTLGLFLAGISFLIAAILQLEIDKITTPLPGRGEYSVRVVNDAPCNLTFTTNAPELPDFHAGPYEISETKSIFIEQKDTPDLELRYIPCGGGAEEVYTVTGEVETVHEVIIRGAESDIITEDTMITHKTEDGGGKFSFLNGFDMNVTISIEGGASDEVKHVTPGVRSEELSVDIGITTFEVKDDVSGGILLSGEIYIEVGAIYTVVVRPDNYTTTLDVNPNSLSVAWIFPQFFIITVGEVFLSVTGLEFSYTQAPPSMKSVVTSIWLLTVSFGNVIVLIIAGVQGIEEQANEFFLFAGLIFVAAIVFIILAYRYVPVNEDEFEAEVRADFERRMEQYPHKISPGYENGVYNNDKLAHEYENVHTGFEGEKNGETVKVTAI